MNPPYDAIKAANRINRMAEECGISLVVHSTWLAPQRHHNETDLEFKLRSLLARAIVDVNDLEESVNDIRQRVRELEKDIESFGDPH